MRHRRLPLFAKRAVKILVKPPVFSKKENKGAMVVVVDPEAKDKAPVSREKASGKRPQILLCPGPVVTTQHVRTAAAGPDMCHREPEFTDLMQTVRAKLLHALGADGHYTSVVLTGSGTAALESAVMVSVEAGKKLLVVNNGVYGSRIAQIARIHGIPLVEIRSPLTDRPDLSRVVAVLKRDTKIGTVAMVHHETSTGLLNPIAEVGALAKQYRRKFFVDAISSLGAEKVELNKMNVSFCVGSSGKCLHGLPGLSFVLVSQEEIQRVTKFRPRSLYLDLGRQLTAQEAGVPPFTPAVNLYSAFHVALDDLLREGLKSRITKYQERAKFLRDGFKKIGLPFLLDEKLLSNTLTALWIPKGMTYQQIHDPLKKAGFVIYAGQSELKGRIFRIAHMGQLLQADLKDFLKSLKDILSAAAAK